MGGTWILPCRDRQQEGRRHGGTGRRGLGGCEEYGGGSRELFFEIEDAVRWWCTWEGKEATVASYRAQGGVSDAFLRYMLRIGAAKGKGGGGQGP